MNYAKVYDSLISRAKTRPLEGYTERHHIIPKCLGGTNNKNNIVKLTAREHFICHWLLFRMHPQNSKLSFAFWKMCTKGNKYQHRYKPSSRTYQEAKENYAAFISVSTKGRKRPDLAERNRNRAGEKQSYERIENRAKSLRGKKRDDISAINKLKIGENNPMYGRVYITDGTNQQIIKKLDVIPEGWRLGRRPRVEKAAYDKAKSGKK